ncbi:MAG TPA: hypothetical protein VLZ78_06135 [Terrimesophilobacter sp.]|nr:hypothetical protein [Terrimesophilobacter sp.]
MSIDEICQCEKLGRVNCPRHCRVSDVDASLFDLRKTLDYAVGRVRDLEAELATEKRNYRALEDRYDRWVCNRLPPEGSDPRPDYTQGAIGEAYVAGNVAAQMGMHHLEQQQVYLAHVCAALKATCEKQAARIKELEAQLAGTA